MKRRIVPHLAHALVFRLSVLRYMLSVPRWALSSIFFAVIIGYNELTKQQTDLGQKAMCRLMRRVAEDAAASLGIVEKVPFFGNRIILEVKPDDRIPPLEFRESDIELMRATVAKFDAEKLESKS